MLIAQQDRDQFLRGIFGQTVATPVYSPTATPTVTPTPTYSPTVTPTVIPTATEALPRNIQIVYTLPESQISTMVRSPADYAKHALEYAFRYFEMPLARTGSQKVIPDIRYNQILDYAYAWSRVRTYPKNYVGLLDGKNYYLRTDEAVKLTSRLYLENYLTRYYMYISQSAAAATPTATVIRPHVITLTPTPTTVMPSITADLEKIVNDNLEFNGVPLVAGTVRSDIYDAIVSKAANDIIYMEYTAPRRSSPPGVTYSDLRERNRRAILSYLNSLGIKRGTSTQRPDYISTERGTSPVAYSREREWWGSTHKERAEWAVRESVRALRISLRGARIMVSTQQVDQIIRGALSFLQAVASDPVFTRDAGDRRDIATAAAMITIEFLQGMGIMIATPAPDWQERARAAVTFWMGRTPDRSMTAAEYGPYLQQVTNTALYYWKMVRDRYIRGGGVVSSPREGTVRTYVDGYLRHRISIEQVVSPTVTPTYSPTVTPTVTPAPTPPIPVLYPATAGRVGLNAAITESDLRNRATARRYGATVYYYLAADLFDQMIIDGIGFAKRAYSQTGADPLRITDSDWQRHVLDAARVARFIRQAAGVVTPVTTEVVVTVTPTPPRDALEALILEAFGNILPRYGLAQRYPAAYYIPDVSRREVMGDLYSEGQRLAGLAKYRQQMATVGGLVLSNDRIDQELRARNIFPESEYAEPGVVSPVVSGDAALREWAATAPIFEDYAQCRAAAEDQVGRVPDQWRDCLTEADMVDQAVTHALRQRGIRPFPGSLELPEQAFDSVAAAGLAITQQMVYQRTYKPIVGGQFLELAR